MDTGISPVHPEGNLARAPSPSKSVQRTAWFWLLVFVGSIALLATGWSETVAFTSGHTKDHVVVLRISGRGTVSLGESGWGTAQPYSSEDTRAILPWTRTEKIRAFVLTVSLTIASDQGLPISCSITVDGRLASRSNAGRNGVVAHCSTIIVS